MNLRANLFGCTSLRAGERRRPSGSGRIGFLFPDCNRRSMLRGPSRGAFRMAPRDAQAGTARAAPPVRGRTAVGAPRSQDVMTKARDMSGTETRQRSSRPRCSQAPVRAPEWLIALSMGKAIAAWRGEGADPRTTWTRSSLSQGPTMVSHYRPVEIPADYRCRRRLVVACVVRILRRRPIVRTQDPLRNAL